MLEKRIIIYSQTASTVTTFILALCSLFPGLLVFNGNSISSPKLHAFLVFCIGKMNI